MNKIEKKKKLAILEMEQEAIRLVVVDNRHNMDDGDAIEMLFYAKIQEAKEFKAKHFPPSYHISGYESNERISHYDIEDAIKRHIRIISK